MIVNEGDASHYAYVVLAGKAKVLRKLDDRQVQVGEIGEGQLFGEASFLGTSRRSATVLADGDLELGLIPSDLFSKALSNLPTDAQQRLARLVKDLGYLNDIYIRLSGCVDELEELHEGLLEEEPFVADIEGLPELPQRIATQMRNRLKASACACSELFQALAIVDHSPAKKES